ncbi:DUF7527 domain-containing protein [Halocatena pleomorpha]|uniref:DUF7527 domain-containing protein n=1 Tax=Halocatena pleomorpha TaxID=1785090 RepID=A0A3P3RGG1_9EURY|nr:hypothetical protein [Halocatena pleomorpha]RRJ32018.1 hypothetical protein EIK79_05680 [Halocatena pleomorpha]
MQRRTVERIEGWPSRQFTQGDVGLRDLASAGFSGAVHAGTWILMSEGQSVGVFDGDVDEITSVGTIYISPDPVLPVLFSMLEQEPVRSSSHHTTRVPLKNQTNAFDDWNGRQEYIGYLRLSSDGDEYYVVYDQTGSTSVAFVGPENRFLTNEQADTIGHTITGEYTVAIAPIAPTPVSKPANKTPSDASPSALPGQSERLITDGASESVEDLRRRITALERERDALKTERDNLLEERDHLNAKITRLQEQLNDLESASTSRTSSTNTSNATELVPEKALSGTSLFVRYHNQNRATLTDAYHGEAPPEEVNDNLTLEHHTSFDAENTVVENEPFEQFLTDSIEFDVVSWVVRDLLHVIYNAGYEDDLAELYDYIPDIDRAALHARNTVDSTSIYFDVVCFDKRGDPLLVINIHDSNDPTTEMELETLLDDASVAASEWPVTGALLVTTSYFESNALTVADDATAGGGGLFSSSSRANYVRLSRKSGFHLCLVEARQRQFHVAMPDL